MRSEKGAPNGSALTEAAVASGVQEEALEILIQLQYKKDEAREMVRKALSRKPEAKSAEEILNEVYRQRKEKV